MSEVNVIEVTVELPADPSVVVLVPGPAGPAGPAGGSDGAALDAHIASTTPHVAATSGRDFAAWYNAGKV